MPGVTPAIRPFVPGDADRVADLLFRLLPASVQTPDSIRHRHVSEPERARRESCVAVDGDDLVAFATAYLHWFGGEVKGRIWVGVREDRRRRGIGTALWEGACSHLPGARLTVEVDDDPAGLRFVEVRGFEQYDAEVISMLDPRECALERKPQEGCRAAPLREMRGREQELFEFVSAAGGIPLGDPVNRVTSDEWQTFILGNPALDYDASVVIVDAQERVVSLSWLLVDRSRRRAENEWTATLPKLRGRGLARLAKLASIRWAAEHGITEIVTGNDPDNLPMRKLNQALGYRELFVRRDLELRADRAPRRVDGASVRLFMSEPTTARSSSTRHRPERPRIGMLWGDFPWAEPPRKIGKMLSVGVTARMVTRALGSAGEVVPYVRPRDESPTAQRDALEAFLRRIDVLWADAYPQSDPAIRVRHELELDCAVILWAGGAMPKAAEAMLFPWQGLLRPGDGLLFTSAADREIWQRLVRRSTLHEWVVPLAVDQTVFYPRPEDDRAATRELHRLPARAPLLLYVGRFNIQKNLHTLLRLLAEVRQRVPGTQLCLVGEEDDIGLWEFGARNTGYVRWLRQLAGELGVGEAITFVDPRFGDDLAHLYNAADVLVNLGFYHRENFGLAQAEAQACGVPAVCTAWGGFKDVVRDGETGYLVDAVLTKRGVRVDWMAACNRVVRLLQDPVAREQMSARATTFARERFSLETLAHGLSAVVADAGSPSVQEGADRTAYDPSDFAGRLEAHKRACGWNADPHPTQPVGYPPMFHGQDYELYEQLLGSYATRLAGQLSVEAIGSDAIPYLASPIALDPIRRTAEDLDPIWPQRRYLSPLEWEILRRVDGTATVARIAEAIAADDALTATSATLWHLHVDGMLLFRR